MAPNLLREANDKKNKLIVCLAVQGYFWGLVPDGWPASRLLEEFGLRPTQPS